MIAKTSSIAGYDCPVIAKSPIRPFNADNRPGRAPARNTVIENTGQPVKVDVADEHQRKPVPGVHRSFQGLVLMIRHRCACSDFVHCAQFCPSPVLPERRG